jgi:MFS transporter, PAT family, beta-lactamase induction signal transducer AmpG
VKARRSFITVFTQPKMAALMLLGFASGLPLNLTSDTLQAWMTVEKIDVASIGLLSLVKLPYSFKFIWSPLLDRFMPPFLGRRRGWLVLTQVGLFFAIAAMALQNPHQALQLLAINALLIAFFSATQDIGFDAYRTDVLDKPEMGAGAAVGVLGYRIALLVTGSLVLILADPKNTWHLSWPVVYILMAILMGIGMVTSFWAPEPILRDRPPQSLKEAVTLPFLDFFQRSGVMQGFLILAFIFIYKLGDSLVKIMSKPFLLPTDAKAGLIGLGFSQTDVGAIQGGMGLVATIIGTLIGGAIIAKIGINKSLWIFAGLQAASNLSYVVLALVGKNYPLMVGAINVETFCAGLETAAFVAFLMSLCNPRFSATQYALFSSLMAFSRDILVAPAGILAKAAGWPLYFAIASGSALLGMLLLPFFAPWNADTPLEMPRPGLDED